MRDNWKKMFRYRFWITNPRRAATVCVPNLGIKLHDVSVGSRTLLKIIT